MSATPKELVAALDATAIEVTVLKDNRFRVTSVREMRGEDLGPALAAAPLANVTFVRDVPPELRVICPARGPADYATAHAERTNHCAAHVMGCKFSVRGNSVGRHEQV